MSEHEQPDAPALDLRGLRERLEALAGEWEHDAPRYGGAGVQKAMDYCAAELLAALTGGCREPGGAS